MTDLPFPSVTICSPGLNMDAVEEALVDDFEHWLASEGRTDGSLEDRLTEFMEETFATSDNIFETIKAMNIPSASDEKDTSGLLQKMAACEAKESDEGRINRRKREAEGGKTKHCKSKKWPLYCPQGSGTLRQQLLIMHGIASYCMVLHCIA